MKYDIFSKRESKKNVSHVDICRSLQINVNMSGELRGVLDLHGKNAVITGASSGIGKVVALTLAKEG